MQYDLQFDWLLAEHIERAYEIESQGYPVDEAASLQAFRDRQRISPPLFLGAYAGIPSSTSLIGYICATRSSAESLTHDSMSHHEEAGTSVCIHSVCVDTPYRRKGVALKLLEEYVRRLSEEASVHRILLIAHEELVQLYEKAGFEYRGKSDVQHGNRSWYELRRVLCQESISPAILEALSKTSQPKLKIDYSQITTERLESGQSMNPRDLLCPRPGCDSIILKEGIGKFHLKSFGINLNPLDTKHTSLSELPPSTAEIPWWLITPSPMEFENIAFSRPVPATGVKSSDKPIKFLACAECDLGPLGWCYEGSSEFWIAAPRVAYRLG